MKHKLTLLINPLLINYCRANNINISRLTEQAIIRRMVKGKCN